MKSITKTLMIAAASLLLSFGAKSQLAITNSLSCAVIIKYEMRSGTTCNVCAFGSVTVQPNTTQNVSLCASFSDLCIWVDQVGTCAVNGLHLSNGCHGTSLTDTGTEPPPCCGNTPVTWVATYNWNITNPTFLIQ